MNEVFFINYILDKTPRGMIRILNKSGLRTKIINSIFTWRHEIILNFEYINMFVIDPAACKGTFR